MFHTFFNMTKEFSDMTLYMGKKKGSKSITFASLKNTLDENI